MNNLQKLGLVGIALVTLFMVNDAYAEENKVTNWLQKEWNEIVIFQKQGWQDGKEQLANNKVQIQTLFNKVKNYVSQN